MCLQLQMNQYGELSVGIEGRSLSNGLDCDYCFLLPLSVNYGQGYVTLEILYQYCVTACHEGVKGPDTPLPVGGLKMKMADIKFRVNRIEIPPVKLC